MYKNNSLLEKLMCYNESDFYPFHMPGHKRQAEGGLGIDFPNPFSIDITEIDGFDNLHHPEEILKDSMEWAASVYGADKFYYLINGSSGGILSAICGVTRPGSKILMSRNCHKSAYHGIVLNQLQVEYIYPQIIDEYYLQGGIDPGDVKRLMEMNSDIEAVLVVSPTYEGVVSDIKSIADIVHSFHKPLIVDEAHGAHFAYGNEFPKPALDLGADIVIQSLHKTLPSLTQTAVMQVREGIVDVDRIEYYLQVFQSSSPSYVLMASMEHCIRLMNSSGRKWMDEYSIYLNNMRNSLLKLRRLKMMDKNLIGKFGIYDMDISKIVVSSVDCGLSGKQLCNILRKEYHLEMEMCGPNYIIALSSIMDTQDGFKRLVNALGKIDSRMALKQDRRADRCNQSLSKPKVKLSQAQAMNNRCKCVKLKESGGKVSAEFIYLYPPGIPIIVPGEVISEQILGMVLDYIRDGLPVQGLGDKELRNIKVVDL